jgi:hypothetical protein
MKPKLKYLILALVIFGILFSPGLSLSSDSTNIILALNSPTTYTIELPRQTFNSSIGQIDIYTTDVMLSNLNPLDNPFDSTANNTVQFKVSVYIDGNLSENLVMSLNHCRQGKWRLLSLIDWLWGVPKETSDCSYTTDFTKFKAVFPEGLFGPTVGVTGLGTYETGSDKTISTTESFRTKAGTSADYKFVINVSVADETKQSMFFPPSSFGYTFKRYYVRLEEGTSIFVIHPSELITYLIEAFVFVTKAVVSLWKIAFVVAVTLGIIIYPIFLFALTRELFSKFRKTLNIKYEELGGTGGNL